jgi:hypothetical protein
LEEYEFGLAEISFMGEITAGRIIFGPDIVEPILGVTALESVGITIDAATRTLKTIARDSLKVIRFWIWRNRNPTLGTLRKCLS